MHSSRPIFLAGIDRSGIGLLGELLEAHPNLAISRRTNFWSFYHGRFGDLQRMENLERCVAEMMRYTRIQALHPDPEELLAEVRKGPATYARLFAALQEQHLRYLGKVRWGDKSLNSEGHAEVIFREFPGSVMVHVIRDPRDRYASRANHRRTGRGGAAAGVALWLWSVRLAEHNRARYPGRYKVVKYEDLVTRPREVLGDVCDFLGEDFSDDMLAVAADPVDGPTADRRPRTFTTTSINRFRRDLTDREIAFIQLVAGRRMNALGYELHRGLSQRDRLLFAAVDVPLQLARMAAWRMATAAAGRFGSGPSDRRLAGA